MKARQYKGHLYRQSPEEFVFGDIKLSFDLNVVIIVLVLLHKVD